MKPPPRVRFDGWPALLPVLDWGEDPASPLRRWWFAVEAPEPSPAATFLEKLALSGSYVRVHTPTRALGTVVCTVPISRDGVFRAHFAGVGEPLVR